MNHYTETIASLVDSNKSNIDYTKNRDFFICIYGVMGHNEQTYVCYLTHINSVKIGDKVNKVATFPFVHGNQNVVTIKKNIESLSNSMIQYKSEYKGFTLSDDKYFLFYEATGLESPLGDDDENQLYWTSLHEMLNTQKILGVPIHSTVYKLFFNEPMFIHFSNKDIPIEINLSIPKNKSFLNIFQKYDADKKMFIAEHSDRVDTKCIRTLLFKNDKIIFQNGNIYYSDKNQLLILSISQS